MSPGVYFDTEAKVRMGEPSTFGHVSVPAEQMGENDVHVPSIEVEDHVRVVFHPDTPLVLGYFNMHFGGIYAQYVRTMLKAPTHTQRGLPVVYPFAV